MQLCRAQLESSESTASVRKVVEGKDDDELWEKAQAHLAADHPDLVGKVSREDILAQAEEI